MHSNSWYNEGNINDKTAQVSSALTRSLITERVDLSMTYSDSTTTPVPCYLYLIVCGDACKIGITSEPANRISYLQTANPTPLTVVCLIECCNEITALQLETLLHRRYIAQHIRGEWFSVHPDIVMADIRFALSVAALESVPTIHIDNMPKPTSTTNPTKRIFSATQQAKEWLIENPDKLGLSLRLLADLIGVGKDSVAKALKEISQ
jgi:hypothetical protein